MSSEPSTPQVPRENPFSAEDVAAILCARGWMEGRNAKPEVRNSELQTWLETVGALLGPQSAEGAADLAEARAKLEGLLGLVFEYDARAILATAEAQEVLLREGARDVVRELAHIVLSGPEIDSDRFKEIIDTLKGKKQIRGWGLFRPLRLALAGRTGEGELDRVILLLDAASKLEFAVPVKGTRQRMLEFCSALD